MNKPRYGSRNKYGRFGWSTFMLIGIGLVVTLFFVKNNALAAKARLGYLERVLVQERAEVRMLKAEVAHLESPERLRRLATDHLGLEPVSADRILSLSLAVKRIPKKSPTLHSEVLNGEMDLQKGAK